MPLCKTCRGHLSGVGACQHATHRLDALANRPSTDGTAAVGLFARSAWKSHLQRQAKAAFEEALEQRSHPSLSCMRRPNSRQAAQHAQLQLHGPTALHQVLSKL